MKVSAKFLVVALVILLAAVLPWVVTPALASTGPAAPAPLQAFPEPMDLNAFLQWLVGGAGSIIAVSWVFERMPWFQKLSATAKDYTIFGAAAVTGCVALAVVTYAPAALLASIAPYFLIISGTFGFIFVAKGFHRVDKLG